MKRRITKGLLAAMMCVSMTLCLFAGCVAQEQDEVGSDTDTVSVADIPTVNVAALNGPTGISMAKLAVDAQESGRYNVTFAGSPDEIVGLITTGEVDVACVPTNLAATLYNKTSGGIRVAAVTTLGVLYILDASGEINTIADLKGHTIGATGQGSNPEYILNYIFKQNGLIVGEDVMVEYYTEHSELATLMVSGEIDTAMLPVPFTTQVQAKREGVTVIDLQDEWSKVSDTAVAQGVIICSADFAENNQSAMEQFLADFEESSDYAVNSVAETAQYVEQLGIISSAAVAEQAIPLCNIVYVDGSEMTGLVSGFLDVLYEANPKAVGGVMPGEDFYYEG